VVIKVQEPSRSTPAADLPTDIARPAMSGGTLSCSVHIGRATTSHLPAVVVVWVPENRHTSCDLPMILVEQFREGRLRVVRT